MRINLVTPFAEKDAVKALGARWDAGKKLWYIVDVADLTPFLRWIPNAPGAADGAVVLESLQAAKPKAVSLRPGMAPALSQSVGNVPHCGCQVLPWEDCLHTTKQ